MVAGATGGIGRQIARQLAEQGARLRHLMDVARVIAASPTTMWSLIARPHRWPEWGPTVRQVECGDTEIRAGTHGRVRTSLGVWLPFTITTVDPGRGWHWRVGGLTATGHRIEPIGDHHTRVVFEIPWWGLPYGIVCSIALRNLARRAGNVPAG